ncbi:hypothetical protein [Moorena sp. SIO3I6]|nr:hypothetical protein [Moorena sp. SIO3I6]NEP29101.1 hypothetical protein [Moorena sp. SIO3I6]
MTIGSSDFPLICSLLPAPCSLLPAPCSLKPINLYLMGIIIARIRGRVGK